MYSQKYLKDLVKHHRERSGIKRDLHFIYISMASQTINECGKADTFHLGEGWIRRSKLKAG
jgi:hypothetical protein